MYTYTYRPQLRNGEFSTSVSRCYLTSTPLIFNTYCTHLLFPTLTQNSSPFTPTSPFSIPPSSLSSSIPLSFPPSSIPPSFLHPYLPLPSSSTPS